MITGAPAQDGPSAGIYIAFGSPGDLWVDDVELREGGPSPETARVASLLPERKGNLVYNSGFELGTDGWGPIGLLKVDSPGAAQGHACARCSPTWDRVLLESRPVVIRAGQRHTISASIRASEPAEVEMVVMEYADASDDGPGQRNSIRQTFRIDQQWRRISSPASCAPPWWTAISSSSTMSPARARSGSRVQWEEGGPRPYQPAAPVETAVRAPSQLLTAGQPAVTECRTFFRPHSSPRR